MRAALPLAALALAFSTPAGAQDWYGEDYQACTGGSTQAIVECVDRETQHWDERLNAAYQEMMDGLEGERRTGLRDVQRRWIAFRDANCGWYAGGEGTITAIRTANCMRMMTMQRAVELELMASGG